MPTHTTFRSLPRTPRHTTPAKQAPAARARQPLPLDEDDADAPAPPAKRRVAAHAPTVNSQKNRRDLDKKAREEDVSRSASRALVHVDTSLPAVAGDPSKVRVLQSFFKKNADHVIKMLDAGETDGAISTTQRALLQTVVDLIPIVEHAVRASNGRYGVYPFNQTVSQLRELLNDIQVSRDRGQMGRAVVENHVRPAFLDIAGQIVLAFTQLNACAAERMSKEDMREFRATSDVIKRTLADYIMAQYSNVADSVAASLS